MIKISETSSHSTKSEINIMPKISPTRAVPLKDSPAPKREGAVRAKRCSFRGGGVRKILKSLKQHTLKFLRLFHRRNL